MHFIAYEAGRKGHFPLMSRQLLLCLKVKLRFEHCRHIPSTPTPTPCVQMHVTDHTLSVRVHVLQFSIFLYSTMSIKCLQTLLKSIDMHVWWVCVLNV